MGELMDTAAWQALGRRLGELLPSLALALVLLVVLWALGGVVQRVVNRLTRLRHLDPHLVSFLGQSARVTFIVLGIVTALGTLGVDVSALVAGLGLTGLTLGFAMKDLVSNAVAGMLVLLYKPFRHGDHIAVTSLEGTVVEINFRYTVLDAEGKWVHIPNASLFTNPVTVRKQTPVQVP